MDSDREQLASVLTWNLPFIFGLVGRRCGGEEETAGEVVERIVVIDPAMQRMILIEADGGSGASLDELVRQASEAESRKRGRPPVSAVSIEAMPTVEVAAEEGMDCAVCLERVMGAAKEMPCRHRYHQECVEKCRPGYLCRVVCGVKLLLDPPYIVRVATLDFLLLACLEIWLCGCMETLDHGSDDHGWRKECHACFFSHPKTILLAKNRQLHWKKSRSPLQVSNCQSLVTKYECSSFHTILILWSLCIM